MKQLDLTRSELFKNLIELNYEGVYIDIHNNYYCYYIKHDEGREIVQMLFSSLDSSILLNKIDIEFKRVDLIKMSLLLQNGPTENLTLDTFYRGRYEVKGVLKEYSDQGKPYFYIDFYEGYSIELFADSVQVFVHSVK
jgi:hypothetical protein